MRGSPGSRALLGVIATVVALLAYASPALAGKTQESIFQDDRLLTNSDYAVQSAALDKLAYLGVDEIHTVVNWRRFAPQPESKTKPPGFIGTDSRSYGPTNWDIYDSLVRGAQARGIRVFMSPAGPIPNWASGCRKNINFACKPSTKLFGEFVTAVATRYSGAWIDEDQDQTALPRVSTWGVWNEPNLGAWLYPQSKRVKRKRVGVGAAYYRRLVYAAGNALNATGHGGDALLIGETAPLGAGPTRTEPGPFLRQLFCLSDKNKVLRGKAAKQQGCAKPKRMKATGISHHPYARGAGVPLSRKQRPGSITIGTIGRLLPIARATARSKVMKKRLPVFITEFGVTTRPPDRKFGVALTRQAQYLNVVDYLAFRKPWIKSVSQFQLEDDTGLADRGTFQTGLMFGTGKAKPSFQAYRIPIFVTKKKKRITVFGQVRPTRAGTAPPTIEIQNKPKGKPFKTVATRKTNARGYVLARFKARKGAWRIRWVEPNGTISFSRGSQAVPPGTPGNPGVPPPGPGTPPPPPPPGSDPGSPPPPGGGGAPPPPGGGGSGGGGTGGGGGGTTEPPPPPPPAQFTLSVTMQFTNGLLGPATGTATSSPAGINCTSGTCQKSYTDGTKVTLTATPGDQTTFDGWSGGGCTGTAPCTVTMTQARSVTASFSRTL